MFILVHTEMPKLVIVSLPRCGRNFIANELKKQGVHTEYQCVKTVDQLDNNADVILAHDFNLDYYDPSRYILRLNRSTEECLRSWFLLDVRQNRVANTKKAWLKRKRTLSKYVYEFDNKYKYVDTIWFYNLLEHPNTVLSTICSIIQYPYIWQDFPKHEPRDLNIFPFI